jgi:hypothetical protein
MEDHTLDKYRYDKEIMRLTIEQIKKDFADLWGNIVISENPDTLFGELTNQIVPILKFLYQTNRNGLRSLLYRIDLKESEITGISASRLPELAEKIIRREFQKILIRKYFSS